MPKELRSFGRISHADRDVKKPQATRLVSILRQIGLVFVVVSPAANNCWTWCASSAIEVESSVGHLNLPAESRFWANQNPFPS